MKALLLNKSSYPSYAPPSKPFNNFFIGGEAEYYDNPYCFVFRFNTNRYSDNTISATIDDNENRTLTSLSMAAAQTSLLKEWDNEDSNYWSSYPNIK